MREGMLLREVRRMVARASDLVDMFGNDRQTDRDKISQKVLGWRAHLRRQLECR